MLRPEWEEHVSHWIPEPIPGNTQTGEPAAEEPQVSEPEPEPITEDAPEVDPAAVLRTAASAADVANGAAREASATLTETVREARRAGLSWAKIGALTGMSRQSAHERWRA